MESLRSEYVVSYVIVNIASSSPISDWLHNIQVRSFYFLFVVVVVVGGAFSLIFVFLLLIANAINFDFSIDSSECGPLTNGIKGILPFDEDNVIWNVITYVFKPGFISIIIVALRYIYKIQFIN